MSLPGKLCVGILEEDNPLRSYFRFKPLLVDEGGVYMPFEAGERYPDEGCIRIVPDKNESYHFKARMRQMGLYCVVDLREHPNDNDKIRPNKNYRPDGEEINAYIIYSDVVRGPAPGMIFELLPAAMADSPVPTPNTSMVLLEKDGAADPICYTWEAVAEGRATLRATPAVCPLEGLQTFEFSGFRDKKLRFAIRAAATMDAVSDMPPKIERPEPIRPVMDREKPEIRPVPQPVAEPKPIVEPKPVAVPEAPAAPEKPVAVEKPAAPEKPAVPEKPVTSEKPAAPEAPAAPGNTSDKPWIHRDESIMPRPANPRLSRTEQMRASQAGLNPRRGRSLQELIDEKWQQSRLDQLGMTAGPIVTGAPVQNPMDAAVESLKEIWANPDMRRPLIDAVSQVDDFLDSLRKFREQAGLSLVEHQLDDLEAQRLELLNELEKLKAGGKGMREQLKQEIRREEAAALAEAVEKTRVAREEQARFEQLASDARAAAKDARGVLDSLAGEQLEQKIRDVALTRRVEERLDLLKAASEGAIASIRPEKIDIEAFIDRFTRRFTTEGWSLSRMEAANLCVCLAIGPTLTLTGAPGSGKTTAARMLADALGLSNAHRVAMCPPETKNALRDNAVDRLRHCPEVPAMTILDDANLCPAPDALRGLGQICEDEWRTVLTVQDAHSGAPLNAAELDRGFVVRMSPSDALPWKPGLRKPLPVFAPASIQALQASLPEMELPAALVARMQDLRDALSKHGASISRRALDDTWRYCAAMLAVLGDEADPDRLFDLAVAQRILPGLLASAPLEAVVAFRREAEKLPLCKSLLKQPLPFMIG